MSNSTETTSSNDNTFAGTLTGGVREVAAILPLLGTEQCEKHVGSALEGGWLYAVATGLSIFGSLGIVKTGISVLIASASFYRPTISFTPFPKLSAPRLLRGAKVLDNAGIKPAGTVAPMIGMQGRRYQAEDKLIQLLEEKHIDNPHNLSISWRSLDWNIFMVLSSSLVFALALLPYIPVISALENFSNPWVYPILRVSGSVVASITCQFILQHRIVSLMKNRLVFMCMDKSVQKLQTMLGNSSEPILPNPREKLVREDDYDDEDDEATLASAPRRRRDAGLQSWDPTKLAWRVEDVLPMETSTLPGHGAPASRRPKQENSSDSESTANGAIAIEMHEPLPLHQTKQEHDSSWGSTGNGSAVAMNSDEPLSGSVKLEWDPSLCAERCLWNLQRLLSYPSETRETFRHIQEQYDSLRDQLDYYRQQQFPSLKRDRYFFLISWLFLLLSLPAILVGYVGCFTLVSSNPDGSNASIVWLGAEAGLAVLRIMLWAWNPAFDEETDATVELKLSNEALFVTTEKSFELIHRRTPITLPLMPEQQFLQRITPYTGPLEQFQAPKNIALFFTLVAKSTHLDTDKSKTVLYMSVLDVDKRTWFTLVSLPDSTSVSYFNVTTEMDSTTDEFVARLGSELAISHPRRANHVGLCDALSQYYSALLRAMCRSEHSIVNSPVTSIIKRRMPFLSGLFFSERAVVTGPFPTSTEIAPTNKREEDPSSQLPAHGRKKRVHWHIEDDGSGMLPGPEDSILLAPSAQLEEHLETPVNGHPTPPTDPQRTEPNIASLQRKWNMQTKEIHSQSKHHLILREIPVLTEHDVRYLTLGEHHRLKSNLIEIWEQWILTAMNTMQDIWLDVHPTAKNVSQTDFDLIDVQLLLQHYKRESMLFLLSLELENHLFEQWKSVTSKIPHVDPLWFASEWSICRQRRWEEEKQRANARVEAAREEATERAEKQGRPHDGSSGIGEVWKMATKLLDKKWTAENDSPDGADETAERLEDTRIGGQSLFSSWDATLDVERDEMAAVVHRIKNGEPEAYDVPRAHKMSWAKFGVVTRPYNAQSRLALKLSSALVFNVFHCNAQIIQEVINKPTTRSVIKATKSQVRGLEPNGHLFYIGDKHDEEIVLPWVLHNRQGWWNEQSNDSFTFYFSPTNMLETLDAVASWHGRIARIMIFLDRRARLRLRLLHRRSRSPRVFVQKSGQDLTSPILKIPIEELPKNELRWSDFDLPGEYQGRVELDLVVQRAGVLNGESYYCLRDIVVDFVDLHE